jgi:ATP-dependent DNA helicase RecQ
LFGVSNEVATEQLLEKARVTLRQSFGYPGFRPGQERAIASILSGRDTLVVLPTGGGKSLCYQVPALMTPGLTVVVSPLISLMKDQVDALSARALPAAFINSTLTSSRCPIAWRRRQRGDIKMLYVAPSVSTRGRRPTASVQSGCRCSRSTKPTASANGATTSGRATSECALCASGSAPRPRWRSRQRRPEVRKDIVAQLALRNPTIVVTGFDRSNLHYHVIPTRTDQEKDETLVQTLREHDGLAVVYASTRRNVERITGVLERAASRPRHTTPDWMTPPSRSAGQLHAEHVRAIVATNAFGMGIDKPNVRLVVHHAMPGTLEAYYQEAGRAGRDGLHSECVLLHSFPDRFTHEFFIKGAYPERPVVEAVYAAMQRVVDAPAWTDLGSEEIARFVPGKVGGRDIDSVLRILQRADVVRRESESGSSVSIRLLATPERIRRELPDSHNPELGLLRALWRAVGARPARRCRRGAGRSAARIQWRSYGHAAPDLAAVAAVPDMGTDWRRHAADEPEGSSLIVSHRVDRDRSAASGRSRKARCHAEIRV